MRLSISSVGEILVALHSPAALDWSSMDSGFPYHHIRCTLREILDRYLATHPQRTYSDHRIPSGGDQVSQDGVDCSVLSDKMRNEDPAVGIVTGSRTDYRRNLLWHQRHASSKLEARQGCHFAFCVRPMKGLAAAPPTHGPPTAGTANRVILRVHICVSLPFPRQLVLYKRQETQLWISFRKKTRLRTTGLAVVVLHITIPPLAPNREHTAQEKGRALESALNLDSRASRHCHDERRKWYLYWRPYALLLSGAAHLQCV